MVLKESKRSLCSSMKTILENKVKCLKSTKVTIKQNLPLDLAVYFV